MNYVYLLGEIFLVYFLMVIFYFYNKKDGLFIYVALMSGILSLVMYESIDILSFSVNLDIPILVGIFICNNIIIQKYGMDEIGKVIKTFLISYVMTFVLVNLISVATSSEYNLITNAAYDSLFGYGNLMTFVAGALSVSFMLWCNSFVYHFIRRSRNKLLFSNVGSILIIQFIESIIFVGISYIWSHSAIELFGMIVIRYLLKVVIGMIGLVPVYMIVKRKDK